MLERALSVASNKDGNGQRTVVGHCDEVFSSRPVPLWIQASAKSVVPNRFV